jgi:SPX domain protein involved in polyphosphate accumulation
VVVQHQAVADLRAAGKTDKEIERFSVLFKEVQQQIDAKQLRPFIRTQYMRTAFQVRIQTDTLKCWRHQYVAAFTLALGHLLAP